MDVMEEIVALMPGAAFAADENLRVVAWNQSAEEGLSIAASEAMGKPCYEVVPAVDVETGRPCYEECPLLQPDARPGWAHNRMLKAPWSGGRRTRLDCFLLRCLLPTSQLANLCFMGSPTPSRIEAHSRILEAVEALFPVVTGPADVQNAIKVFLNTVLRATSADAAELFLLDSESEEMALVERQGAPSETVRKLCESAVGGSFPDVMARSHEPLLAVGRWPEDDSSGITGWLLYIPLVAEERTIGTLGIASHRSKFDVATTVRVLLPVVIQISAYLRWAYLAGVGRRGNAGDRAGSEAARLRIHCLGPFRVFLDSKPFPMERFQRFRKSLTLLKYMAAHRGRAVSRDALMELLWPGADPARVSGNLRVVLHTLRRSLEPTSEGGAVSSFVLSRGDLVYLAPSDRVWIDAEEFVQGVRRANELASQGRVEGALGEYRKAASLYQGDYMEDEPYSDWCLFEREHLKEVYLNALKQMALILTEGGQLESALDACRAALEVDPGREEVHRQFMRLLWQAGRRDEALRQYESCHTILQEELGVEPSPETVALRDAMLR